MEKTLDYWNHLIEVNPFSVLLEMEVIEAGDDWIKGRMPLKKQYMNPYEGMHGGSLYALADTIAGLCAVTSGSLVCTIDGHLNYLNAAKDTEYVYCESHVIRAGTRIVACDAKLTSDQGKVFCTGDFNYYKFSENRQNYN